MQRKEPFEIHVATIHDVEGTRLRQQDIEDIDVVQLAVGNMDKGRNVATQVQQRVPFDRGLGGTKQRPREDR